jgi:Putative transmembrane protein (PGPGW)
MEGAAMADPRDVLRSATQSGKRILVAIAGGTVLLGGLALSIPGIPGPGIALVIAGLAILATEFPWARRWLNKVRAYARQAADRLRGRNTRPPAGLPSKPSGGTDRAA